MILVVFVCIVGSRQDRSIHGKERQFNPKSNPFPIKFLATSSNFYDGLKHYKVPRFGKVVIVNRKVENSLF